MNQSEVIAVSNLTHRYGERQALTDVSFTVRAGEVLGLLGPNGAGKTTTVRLLNGLFPPAAGTLRVLGLDPQTQGAEVRRQSGVLTETPALYERLTARQNLHFFGTLTGMPPAVLQARSLELLRFFELEDRADERVANFSKGMKQRLALARALLHHPRLLFLDEPTSGLDPEAARQVHELIASLRGANGQTVLVCTHNLYEAELLCDRLAILNRGRLLALGSLEELRRQFFPALRLQVRFLQPPESRLAEALPALPGVLEAEAVDGCKWRLLMQDETAVPPLVTALAQGGAQITAVQPLPASLEEIYFKLQEQDRGEA